MISIEDPLVKLFKKSELRPIMDISAYHSPEASETDDDDINKRKIVTKDLIWRSTTVSLIFILVFG